MMITSDKFNSSSFRSRFFSPVYALTSGQFDFCINLKYNIFSNKSDGFKLVLENYFNGNELEVLFEIRGPSSDNKWYTEYIQAKNVEFNQFRVSFYYINLLGKIEIKLGVH